MNGDERCARAHECDGNSKWQNPSRPFQVVIRISARSASHRGEEKKVDIIMDNKNRLFVCWNFNVSGRFWYLIHVRWAIYWHPHSRSIAVNYTYDSHIIYVMTYPTIHGPAQRPDPTRMIPTIQLPTCNMGCRFGSNSMRIHVWTVNQPSNNCIHLCNRRKYIQCKRH